MKDLLSVGNFTGDDIKLLISEAIDLKNDGWLNLLDRKVLALVFEKPSLRTRVSFEVAMLQLGGHCIYLSPSEIGLGQRESIPDVARVLCRYADVIAARTFTHQSVELLAQYADVPVINALSDAEHPCQALADLLTIYEKKGDFKKLTVAYIGDGNNVANSLLLAAALTGMNFRIATPEGYAIQDKYWDMAREYSIESGTELFNTSKPEEAARGADVLYTDVWTSMGQEAETELRRRVFTGYQINDYLLSIARPNAIVMHPLPAHHGEEVATGVLDGPHSVVFDQAENRMHMQKAILAWMLGGLEYPLANSTGLRYR